MTKNKAASNQKKLTLVRSTAGRSVRHQATVRCLGLKRLHHTVTVNETVAIKGMIDSVGYLLKVEEA